MYYIISYNIVPCFMIQYSTMLNDTVSYFIVLYNIVSCDIVSYDAVIYTALHSIILYNIT